MVCALALSCRPQPNPGCRDAGSTRHIRRPDGPEATHIRENAAAMRRVATADTMGVPPDRFTTRWGPTCRRDWASVCTGDELPFRLLSLYVDRSRTHCERHSARPI